MLKAGEMDSWLCVGLLMSENGISTLYKWSENNVCTSGSIVTPEATIEYGEWRRLQGYLMLQPRPKKTPSPGILSWSGSLPVWLLPIFAPYPIFPFPSYHRAIINSPLKRLQLIKTLLWWNPMNGPTSDELHSPEETPVLGAIILFTIFALQLVVVCSHNKLCAQLEPDSKTVPHWRILSIISPEVTLFHRNIHSLLCRIAVTTQNWTIHDMTRDYMSKRTNDSAVD